MIRSLNQSNLELKREVNISIKFSENCNICIELEPFKKWLIEFYNEIDQELRTIEYLINLNDQSIHPEIYEWLSRLQKNFRFINASFLPSLYRHKAEDQFTLKILAWIHSIHTQTSSKPFLIVDGDFGIFPSLQLPLTYHFPITSQASILHTPLLFHELGHYLYEYHKLEMDEFVKDFQRKLEGKLINPFQTNDSVHDALLRKNKLIVETWYEWIQELFCDAVGLEMAGHNYLRTFSQYLRSSGRSNFFVPENDLAKRSHPVTMIRIKVLCIRAKQFGFNSAAEELFNEWKDLLNLQGITEEYFGYYQEDYNIDLLTTLDDMLIESSPMNFNEFNSTEISTFNPNTNNFIQLISLAWEKYLDDPENYHLWEEDVIKSL